MLTMNDFFLLKRIHPNKVIGYDRWPTIAMKQMWVYSALRKSVYDKLPERWQPYGNLSLPCFEGQR